MNEKNYDEKFLTWESLKCCLSNNIDYLKCEKSNSLKLHGALLERIIHQIDEAKILYKEIESFSKEYDVDENLQANGYRSFLKIFDSAINHVSKTLQYFTENRSRILFRKNHYIKEIEACYQLLSALNSSFNQLISFHTMSDMGNLFPNKAYTARELLNQTLLIDQSAFYGRCLGFQYYDSIKHILKFISVSMASYSESYYNKNNKFVRTSNSIFNSGRYFLDPEMLANRIVDLSQNASIDFCKSFWCLTESEMIHSIPFVNYSVKVNRLIRINPKTLQIPTVNNEGLVEVESPGIIQMRLISSQRRCGMVGEYENKSLGLLPKSKEILLHCHGGGFVAQSSKSHLVYLLEWAVNFNIPIISIDYSLAPEFPYPHATNEIFFAYCWALQNSELLGWSGEKIILCGDSAGANLCLSTLIRSISLNIKLPDGIFMAYCPIMVSFNPSPSRLLSLQDPLIPFGFLIRCLKAYVLNEKDKNKIYTEPCEKIDNNNSNNDESSSSNKSDSFEEISCFECHQTDSDIKAHISQVSTASNDTLAGTSFLTVTEKNGTNKDTLETESPVDSIRSTVSLEKDYSYEGDKMDKMDVDSNTVTRLVASTSETCNTQYVNEFVGKYSLDDRFETNSNLRKTSRTRSEENIIFDVSKETLCVRNLQRKFRYAASSLAKTFCSTFGEMTKNNHLITNKYELENEASSYGENFEFEVSKDPLMSPYYVDDEILAKFPPVKILSLTLDSCLDDSVMFVKRLKALNISYTLDVLDKLPHGFLNFARLSKEAHEGSKLAMKRIAELLDLNLDSAVSFR